VKAGSRWHCVSEHLVQRGWRQIDKVGTPARPRVFLGLHAFCPRRPGILCTGLWSFRLARR